MGKWHCPIPRDGLHYKEPFTLPRIRLLGPWFGSTRFKGKDHTIPPSFHSTLKITEVREAKVTGSRQVVARLRPGVCRPAGRAMSMSWHGLPGSP